MTYKGIVHTKILVCWKCIQPQVVQDVDEFVSSDLDTFCITSVAHQRIFYSEWVLFGLSFWRHPFTAEDPFVSKWYNAKSEETNSYIQDGLSVSSFSFNFWVNYFLIFKFIKIVFCVFLLSTGNTVSNLIMILPPIYGAIQTYKDGLEVRYVWSFLGIAGNVSFMWFLFKPHFLGSELSPSY